MNSTRPEKRFPEKSFRKGDRLFLSRQYDVGLSGRNHHDATKRIHHGKIRLQVLRVRRRQRR